MINYRLDDELAQALGRLPSDFLNMPILPRMTCGHYAIELTTSILRWGG